MWRTSYLYGIANDNGVGPHSERDEHVEHELVQARLSSARVVAVQEGSVGALVRVVRGVASPSRLHVCSEPSVPLQHDEQLWLAVHVPVDLKRLEELSDIFRALEQLRLLVGQEEQALLPTVDLLDHLEHRACFDLLVQLMGEFVVLEHGGSLHAIFPHFLVEGLRRLGPPQRMHDRLCQS